MGDLFETLEKELPALIARREVPRLCGGIVSQKTLANCDAMGTGPTERTIINGHVTYTRAALVVWLRSRPGTARPDMPEAPRRRGRPRKSPAPGVAS